MARLGIEPRTSDLPVRYPTDCRLNCTVKVLKFGTPQTIVIIVLKIEKFDVTLHPKDADGMANSVDPDQTASSEAV